MRRSYDGSIGGECGKCGEFYGVKSNRMDAGPDNLILKPRDEWDDPSENAVSFDFDADTPELHMHCPDCDVWTVWVFDTDEYVETGGADWSDPTEVYWIDGDRWGDSDNEPHRVALYPIKDGQQ